MDTTAPEQRALSVSELNSRARDLLEGEFPEVLVEGEISNLATPASGHIYFSLKDSNASVRCALFRSQRAKLAFVPENGAKVLAAGKLSIYTLRGDYQMIAHAMHLAGAGNLHQQYQQLKKKLHAEGLFSQERPLPKFPGTIGIVTSPHGAAIRDALSVLKRRCPAIRVIVYPCQVQGTEAASDIVGMLQLAAARMECDVLLVIRGGGSMEDMQAFNEEAVARAVVACPMPVISGVGHEVDFCITDFAADLRAATPSAAAESASPDQRQLQSLLRDHCKKMLASATLAIDGMRKETAHLISRLKTPEVMLETMRQRVDELQLRILAISNARLGASYQLLEQCRKRLRPPDTGGRRKLLNMRQQAALTAFWQSQRLRRSKVDNLVRTLQAMNPDKVLKRGYAMALLDDKVVEAAAELKPKDKIKLLLGEGAADCTVDDISKERP